MTKRVILTMVIAGLGLISAARADEAEDAKIQKQMSKLVDMGPGVHKIQTDKQGRIQTCVIVGQSRISTALGKAKGLEVARDRAALSAKAEFVKWLKERVSVYSKTEDETILFLEGSEQNDADTLKESGKSVEKTGKKIETIAEGLVRGLQVIHTEVTDKDKMLTVVYGWDAKTAEASKKVRKDLNSDDKSSGTKEGDSAKKSGPKDKKIEDKKMTSEDAKKFLGDK